MRPKTARSDIEIAVRRGDGFLYVIAVKRGGDTARIQLVGLPKKARRVGAHERRGAVRVRPEPAAVAPPRRDTRSTGTSRVAQGGFSDWFAPYDVHVYRFTL